MPQNAKMPNPLHKITPMRADIAEGSRWPTSLGIDPPAGGLGVEQPVLQIAAVHQVDRPELLRLDSRSHFARHRVEPVRERDGVDHTRVLGDFRCVLGVLEADSKGLLAEHVLAGLHQSDGVRNVGGVRRADVNDLGLTLGHLLDAAVCLLDPPGLGDFPRAFRA